MKEPKLVYVPLKRQGQMPLAQSTSVAVMSTLGIEPVDRTAPCVRCGRPGTIAYIATGSPPETVQRFCRRCWPSAQIEEIRREAEAHENMIRRHRDQVAAWRRGEREPFGDALLPAPRATGWHWSATLGTLFRWWWYGRKYRRRSKRTYDL